MNPMHLNKPAERDLQDAYVLGKIICLPHYVEKGKFVWPGHTKDAPRIVSRTELINRGAKKVNLYLWKRAYA